MSAGRVSFVVSFPHLYTGAGCFACWSSLALAIFCYVDQATGVDRGLPGCIRNTTFCSLSPDPTFVLVNGRRHHTSARVNTGSPIGRIEVLRDGASAYYGSDATAGVIDRVFCSAPWRRGWRHLRLQRSQPGPQRRGRFTTPASRLILSHDHASASPSPFARRLQRCGSRSTRIPKVLHRQW